MTLKTERYLILSSFTVCALSLLGITLWQSPNSWVLWLVLAASSTGTMMMQARVSVSLPKAISGRGNVALNLVIFLGGFILQGGIGWLAQRFATVLDMSATAALAATFASLAVMQLLGIAWLWAHWRKPVNFDEPA